MYIILSSKTAVIFQSSRGGSSFAAPGPPAFRAAS
jgi:hypothetical protein